MFSHIQIQHMNSDKSAENYILFASDLQLEKFVVIFLIKGSVVFLYIKDK